MKAEHRKELQTNLLADRMGRLIQNVKGRPSRRGVLTALLVVVLLVGLVIIWWVWSGSANANSERWIQLEQAPDMQGLRDLIVDYPTTQQGKAARMQLAWVHLWEGGIKNIGRQPASAFKYIAAAKEEYEKLKDDCKDDPILGSEALNAIAVAEESLACDSRLDASEQLNRALLAYKEVLEKFPNSAYGARAEKRITELESKEGRAQIENFYQMVRMQVNQFFQSHQDPLKMLKK